MKKNYETKRLTLRVIDHNSVQLVLDYLNRNKDFLRHWEPCRDIEYYTMKFQEEILRNEFEDICNGKGLRLWITKREEERIIGCVAFNNIVRGAFQSCHLGYKLDKDEIGKGYITEALKKGISIIFEEYLLHRIEANIMPRNKASIRVVEKLGFYDEGLAKDYLKINGKWENHIHMVLLNSRV